MAEFSFEPASSRTRKSRACKTGGVEVDLREQSHKTFSCQIRHEKGLGSTSLARNLLCGNRPASHRAFHRGRPSGRRPVSRQKHLRPWALPSWTIAIDSWRRRKRGVHFLDDRRFDQLGIARGGKELAHFA